MDDTFVIWNEGRNKLQDFLKHLNTIRPSIQFTMELEEDKKLSFLYVLVIRGADKLTTTVYRKATHTDWYIHFTSNHHNRVKRGIIKCLKWRATRICETGSGSRGGPTKSNIPEERLSREVHRKCNGAENQTGGTARRRDSDRSILPQKEDIMHTTVCKGDFRQDSGHLQKGRSTM